MSSVIKSNNDDNDDDDEKLSLLNAQMVTKWLNKNPDFLNNYLKRIHEQRRSSIMNNESISLLHDLNTTINMNSSKNKQFMIENNIDTRSRLSLAMASTSSLSSSSASSLTVISKNIGKSIGIECQQKQSISKLNLSSSQISTKLNHLKIMSSSNSNSNNGGRNRPRTVTLPPSTYLNSFNHNLHRMSEPMISPIQLSTYLHSTSVSSVEEETLASTPQKPSPPPPSTSTSTSSSSSSPSPSPSSIFKQSTIAAETVIDLITKDSNLNAPQPQTQTATTTSIIKRNQSHNLNSTRFRNLLTNQKKRNEFKNLSMYEKMYTLMTVLNQSLNLEATCKIIMNTVSLLLDADRCSLFLVVNDEMSTNSEKKSLVSVVFDAKSKCDSQKGDNSTQTIADEKIRIPYGKGIAGHVASKGKTLNIPNVYDDERFDSSIDKITGYKTKSMVCLPILDETGQCVAVAEAINKLSGNNRNHCKQDLAYFNNNNTNNSDEHNDKSDNNDNNDNNELNDKTTKEYYSFTKEDEEIFSKFMPFIVIAMRNAKLYAQSQKEAKTNQVYFKYIIIVVVFIKF
jgi:GAF domain-containing protein